MLMNIMARSLRKLGRGFQALGNRIQPPLLPPEVAERDTRARAHQARIDQFLADGGDDQLRFSGYDLGPDSVVFDLGGYHGSYAAEMHARYGCTVHIFEPCQAFCEHLRYRLGKNPAFIIHPFGLASTDQTVRMSLNDQGTSAYRSTEDSFEARLVRAADFFDQSGLARIDLMKINIEGGEYDVLPHIIESGLIHKIRDLQIQFHEDVVPDAAIRMRRIQQDLSHTHRLTWQYEWVWESWRRRT